MATYTRYKLARKIDPACFPLSSLKSNTPDATVKQDLLMLSGAHEFTPSFSWGSRCLSIWFSVLCWFFFVVALFVFILCFVNPMLQVSLDCPFFIVPSVFSTVYWLENQSSQRGRFINKLTINHQQIDNQQFNNQQINNQQINNQQISNKQINYHQINHQQINNQPSTNQQ